MFPYFSPDSTVQAIVNLILALVNAVFHANWDGQENMLMQFCNVISLRAFAGQYWQDATGYATHFAYVIDELLDLALNLLGLDPLEIRGDH